MIKWNTTKEEYDIIQKISERIIKYYSKQYKENYPDRGTIIIDLEACNSNHVPLDFERLLSFPDFDFWHDIFGIYKNINRDNGKLENCFLPRCAKREESEEIDEIVEEN